MHRNIAALGTKFNKFNIPDDDSGDLSDDEEGTGASNHYNQALTFQSKKKGGGILRVESFSFHYAHGMCWLSERNEQVGP
jgi:hypothetical protein